jgi:hypothetical protein
MQVPEEYDQSAAFAPLPVYTWPEGDHFCATALGYAPICRGAGPKVAANLLVKELLRLGLVSLAESANRQKRFKLIELASARELERLWSAGNTSK